MARAGKSLEVLEPAQLTGQLAPLPLSSLRWPEYTVARLACMGVRTIGAALRLPRAGFARRFGDAQLAMLDVLTGRTAEVRVTYRAPERFRRRRELGCELENHGLLLVALAPLLAELGDFLAARDLGVVKLECRLMHRHAPPTRCVVRLAGPRKPGRLPSRRPHQHIARSPGAARISHRPGAGPCGSSRRRSGCPCGTGCPGGGARCVW